MSSFRSGGDRPAPRAITLTHHSKASTDIHLGISAGFRLAIDESGCSLSAERLATPAGLGCIGIGELKAAAN